MSTQTSLSCSTPRSSPPTTTLSCMSLLRRLSRQFQRHNPSTGRKISTSSSGCLITMRTPNGLELKRRRQPSIMRRGSGTLSLRAIKSPQVTTNSSGASMQLSRTRMSQPLRLPVTIQLKPTLLRQSIPSKWLCTDCLTTT